MATEPSTTPEKVSEGKVSSPSPGLIPRLLADGPVRLALGAFTIASCFYLLPLSPEVEQAFTANYFPLLFQVLVLFSLRRDLGRLKTPIERQFWNDLTAAHGSWFAVNVIRLWSSTPSSTAENLAIDSLYCVYYLALVLAIERRVHRLHPWRPTALERTLVWPGALLFVLGLLTYFILAPGTREPLYQDNLPSYVLYLSLDLYVAATFIYLGRTSAAPRWRSLYTVLGIAYGAIFAADLMETTLYNSLKTSQWGSSLDLLWNFPYVLLIVAIRTRHQRFPSPDSETVLRARAEQDLSGPSGRTVGTALTIPFLHFLCFRFGLLQEHRDLRENVVLVWIPLLAVVAAFQHSMLRRRMQKLQDEREEFEASLRDGEKDLRLLVERSHSLQQIRETEQKFTKAFHANPDAMALSDRKEGRILEVNATLLKMSGFTEDDILNKKSTEIGMWKNQERILMLEELEQGGIRDKEALVPLPSGEKMAAAISVEPLEIDEEPCLLTVFQALPGYSSSPQAILFDHSSAAIVMLNSENNIIYWNATAESLYGWTKIEALGSSADLIWSVDSLEKLGEIRSQLTENDFCRRELTLHTKDRELVLDTWWSHVGALEESESAHRIGLPLLFLALPRSSQDPSPSS